MDLRDEIAKAAYYLFEKCGGVHGRHEEHWYEAERAVTGSTLVKSMERKPALRGQTALVSKDGVKVSKPQKRAIWPQDKPAAEGKKRTRARREKTKGMPRP